MGNLIARSNEERRRKAWLACSLAFNLSTLGVFKYCNFFINTLNTGIHAVHSQVYISLLHIILPIGISFYTFNSMSYTIDIYFGVLRAWLLLAVALLAFVALFPHLIAGLIVRYADIEDQFLNLKTRLSNSQAATGIFFFVAGMVKKVLIADRFAKGADSFFASPLGASASTAWIGVLSYTFQIYFDFSAYSDMAVGIAHLMGIQFPQNFDSPYKADSIADFWRRWHISLSTWLRDYLFIPLGGSRGTTLQTVRNLAITMFLGGLWHGASWTFVIWGLYHSILLGGHATLRRLGWIFGPRICSQIVTFLFVVLGWVFFRATTLASAILVFRGMFGLNGFWPAPGSLNSLARLTVGASIVFLMPNTWQLKFKPSLSLAYGMAVAMMLAILMLGNASPFLYFQF